jgi:hypothetical protein
VSPAVSGNTLLNTCPFRLLCNQFARTGGTTFLFKPTSSNYNSLQVKLDRKFTGGLLLKTAYTWGKALAFRANAGSDDGGAVNYLDFQRNYSVLSRNRLHTFVESAVYELPFGQGKRWLQNGAGNWIFGHWGVSGILTRMSGVPLRFQASGSSLNANGTTQVPIQIAPFKRLGGIDTANWFDTTAFCPVVTSGAPAGCPTSPAGTLGNMARYAFSGPGFFNLDAAVFRRFPIRERAGLEFRMEAFGLTNTPQFGTPDAFTDITNASFGKLKTVDGGNRVLEMSARFTF